MKRLNIKALYTVLSAVFLIGFTSCGGDFDRPPFDEPKSDWVPNTTIAELLENFNTDGEYVVPDSTYISGYVSGNDVSGNIYKKMYIQDSTAGVEIEINLTNIHTLYAVGQKVVISLGGLVVGSYGDSPQIGIHSDGVQAGRMSEDDCEKHIQKEGFPNINNVKAKVMTIAEIAASGTNNVAMLVRIDNASFVDAGQEYAPGANTSRPITDGTGSLDVRNSSFADFSSEKIPSGTGSVIGCLGSFRGAFQLSLRSLEDVIFNPIPAPIALKATVDGRNINISYSPAFGTTPESYQIFLDGTLKADKITEKTYVLKDVPPGFGYTVGVRAVYSYGISEMAVVTDIKID